MTRRFDVLSLGEALVDLLPTTTGPLEDVPSFERHPGGAPSNVAIGVARLGGRAAFAGAVGQDPFGRYLARALSAEGVDVSGLVHLSAAKTGLAFVALGSAGVPRFWGGGSGLSADMHLRPDDLGTAPLDDCALFHFGSNLWPTETGREATWAALAKAKRAGALISTDPNLRMHLWSDAQVLRDCLGRAIPQCHVVKVSTDEIGFVTGSDDPAEAVRRLVQQGPRLAVVTMGPRGCAWARRRDGGLDFGVVAAPAARRLVDTTGAGDAFMATLLLGLARRQQAGEDPFSIETARLEALLARATEAGTRVCETLGAVNGLPKLQDFGAVDC